MEETNTFLNRLSRLFSTDVIIRNKGGNQLKVIDINKIQSTNNINTKISPDKSSRIYSPKNTSLFGRQQSLQLNYNRPLLYSDYDLMDTHPIIASVLDIIADESSLKNDMGEVLQIKSSNEDIQRVLYNLHYDILNIEFNLWAWVRQMCKYGDFFLKLNIAKDFGIINVIPYNAFHVERIEGYDPENPYSVKFKYNPAGVTPDIHSYTLANIKKDDESYFENHEIIHFRLITDTNFLPYGRSYIEPVRKLYKQLTMMEDAMLIHRIVRAPDRRVFYVNVASIPPNEVENFMQRTISTMKRTPHINPDTGDYNLKYNLTNLLEDYYLPTRGQDASTKIENLPGLNWVGVEDINYLRDQLFAGLKVPKAFLGYEKDLTGKCLHPDTEIRLIDGTTKTIKEIADLFSEDKNTELYTYSFDFETNEVVPGKIVIAEKTRLNAELVKVYIDNDSYVITTPDHGFLLQDGTRVEAKDLKEGDSLRTIIIRKNPIKKNGSEYEQVYQPKDSKWEYTHKMVDKYFNGKIERNGYVAEGKFDRNSLTVIHHKDFNRYNNAPSNLERMRWDDHLDLHRENSHLGILSDKSKLKSKQTKQTPEYKEKRSNIQKERIKNNPELGLKLKESWMSKTTEERKEVIKSGLSQKRSNKISKNNKERNSVQHLNRGYKEKFPNGRPDLQGDNSIRWKERKTFEELVNITIENKDTIESIKDLNKLTGMCQYMTREVLNSSNYNTNQFLNEFIGFSNNRSKDVTPEYFQALAEGSKDMKDLASKLNMNTFWLNRFIKKYNYESIISDSLSKCYNHKVVKVEWLDEKVDTYNMEVFDYNENHNYLLGNEIVIKNSTLAAEDIRFSRTIDRIQRIVLSELYKLSIIHLYSQGFSKEDITNFELQLTTPSIIYDQERIALLTQKIDLSKQIQESRILPEEWIYDNIWHLSADQINDMRELIVEDAKRTFRIKQITEEGNDPKITGKSYGTPHDLASLYGGVGDKYDKVPDGYDENNPVGRPKEYPTSTHRVDDRFGKDRLGVQGMKKDNDSSDSLRPQYKGGSPLALESKNTKLITELYINNPLKVEFLDEKLLD